MTDLIDRSAPEGAGDDVGPGAEPTVDVDVSEGSTATREVAEPRSGRHDVPAADRAGLAALLAAAGIVHLVMAPSHLGESGVEGAGFVVAGWLQIGLALGLMARPQRWMLQLSVLANVALVAVWAVSRTAGLPFGAHADHAESVSIVDGSVVALELVAVALAVWLLGGRPAVARSGSRAMALTLPVAALVLTSVAIASPSARDHAAGSHGDHMAGGEGGHAHGGEATDDKGLSQLSNGHQHGDGVEELDPDTQAELAVQLAGTAELVERYPTVADAEAAGYRRGGPFAPGLGAHYQQGGVNANSDADGDGWMDPEDVLRPILIYDGTEADSPLAGFMYYVLGEEIPEGFAGPNDHWHQHTNVCVVFKSDGSVDSPFGADSRDVTEEMCSDAGGEFLNVTGNMVHVWTVPGYESEFGTFNEINPAITCPDGTYYTIRSEEIGDRETTCRNT
jgi:hypothetical protein